MSQKLTLQSMNFKPKIHKWGGWWWCQAIGLLGVGATPRDAWEDMHDEWRRDDVFSELTARQRFLISSLENRKVIRLRNGNRLAIQNIRDGGIK